MVWVWISVGLVAGVLWVLVYLRRMGQRTLYIHLAWDGRVLVMRNGGTFWIEDEDIDDHLTYIRTQRRPTILYTREHPTEEPPQHVSDTFAKLAAIDVPIRMLPEPHPDAMRPPPRDEDASAASGHNREWAGPNGYVNCLLVTLADGDVSTVVVRVNEAVPDLPSLAGENEDLAAWLRAQYIEDAPPYPTSVVRVLCRSAGIKGATGEGLITAHHVGDDGRIATREYVVRLDGTEDEAHVTVTLRPAPESVSRGR